MLHRNLAGVVIRIGNVGGIAVALTEVGPKFVPRPVDATERATVDGVPMTGW